MTLLSRALAHLRPAIHGYEHPLLVESLYTRTQAYTPTAYTSDSATSRTVLDFGGGFGLHYKQAHPRTRGKYTRWAIVETSAICDLATQHNLETPYLHWFDRIDHAVAWLHSVDTIHCSGALQYSDLPHSNLLSLLALRARHIRWRRMAFASGSILEFGLQASYLSTNGPSAPMSPWSDRRVLYPIAYIPKAWFMAAHAKDYTLMSATATDFDFELKES